MLTPEQVRKGMEEDRAELVRLGVEYSKERKNLAKKEYEFEKVMAGSLVTYEVNYRQLNPNEKRLPAEDMRKAHALGLIGKAWPDYLDAKANVDSLEKLIRVTGNHLSSLQSELNHLTEELRNSG